MELFPLCLAFGPIAVYLVLLGIINLARHPLLVTATRETLALGLALSGFIIVGPMQLFLPEEAARFFHSFIWVLLVAFYLLCLTLVLLLSRPRLVVYNVTLNQLRPVLGELAIELDPDCRWAGDHLVLPQMGVQLHLEEFPSMRNVSLIATGPEQSLEGWKRLERTLRGRLRQVEVPRNPRGVTLLSSGAAILGVLLYKSFSDPQAIAQGLYRMLRM